MTTPLRPNFETIPQELRNRPQWVVWRLEKRDGDEKPTKVPYQTNERKASTTNPATWTTFDRVVAAYLAGGWDGIGYVFAPDDPYVGADLDDCIADGILDDGAEEWIARFASYAERSQSGAGVHVICQGKLPGPGRHQKWGEIYDQGRFFAITGVIIGTVTAIVDAQETIEAFYQALAPKGAKRAAPGRTNGPAPYSGPDDDKELWDRILASATGAKIATLRTGDLAAYGGDHSGGDLAMLTYLAFWTGKDAERMERMFEQTELANRGKWNRADYRERTIAKAIADTAEIYTGNGHGPTSTTEPEFPERTLTDADAPPAAASAESAPTEPAPAAEGVKGAKPKKPQGPDSSAPVKLGEDHPQLDQIDMLRFLDENEHGDSQILERLYSGRLLYCHGEGRWYVWNGNHWGRDGAHMVRQIIFTQVAAQYAGVVKQTLANATYDDDGKMSGTDKETIKALYKRIGQLRTKTRAEAVMSNAQSRPGLAMSEAEVWNEAPYLLPVLNGVIDLHTGQLRPGRPEDRINVTVPVVYDPDALCKGWIQFLASIFEYDPEIPSFLRRFFGHSLIGRQLEHKLAIFYGPNGRNGKDTMFSVFEHILGPLAGAVDDNVVIRPERWNRGAGAAAPHLVDLQGKRLVWVSETEEGARIDVGQVKHITGGGSITARSLYENMQTWEPSHTLCLMTNKKPSISRADLDRAILERLLLIPFRISFVETPKEPHERTADPLMKTKLYSEAPGILRWLVSGCLEYQDRGLVPPTAVAAATEQYRAEQDNVTRFLQDVCQTGEAYSTGAGALRKGYEAWCESEKIPNRERVAARAFGEKMKGLFDSKRDMVGIVYHGVQIDPDFAKEYVDLNP